MRFYLIVVGVLLAGCSQTYSVRPDLAGDAPTTEVVIESLPKIFSSSVKPTNFAITQARPWTDFDCGLHMHEGRCDMGHAAEILVFPSWRSRHQVELVDGHAEVDTVHQYRRREIGRAAT